MLKFPPDERCPNCGGLYALIGHRHLCRGAPVAPVTDCNIIEVDPRVEQRVRAAMKEASAALRVAASQIEALEAEVKQLKRQLADVASTNVTSMVASTECPTCKARRAAKAKAQRKWRHGSAATATGPVGP